MVAARALMAIVAVGSHATDLAQIIAVRVKERLQCRSQLGPVPLLLWI